MLVTDKQGQEKNLEKWQILPETIRKKPGYYAKHNYFNIPFYNVSFCVILGELLCAKWPKF